MFNRDNMEKLRVEVSENEDMLDSLNETAAKNGYSDYLHAVQRGKTFLGVDVTVDDIHEYYRWRRCGFDDGILEMDAKLIADYGFVFKDKGILFGGSGSIKL